MKATMRTVHLVATLLLLLAVTPGTGLAHDKQAAVVHGDQKIEKVWSRETPKGAKVGVGYIVITNTGSAPDRLVAVESPIAMKTQLHTMTMVDGIMKMRALQNGVEIPADGQAVLKPGSDHVMFMGLKTPVLKGQPFMGTLVFEKAGRVEVEFRTVGIGKSPAHAGHGD